MLIVSILSLRLTFEALSLEITYTLIHTHFTLICLENCLILLLHLRKQ